MTLKIESGTLHTGESKEHVFGSQVLASGVALSHYRIGYGLAEEGDEMPEDDHHVKDISASAVIVSTSGEKVTVKVDGEIRDDSGHVGGGTITYTLFVDVE